MHEERLKTEPPQLLEAIETPVEVGDPPKSPLPKAEAGEVVVEPVEALKQFVSEAKNQRSESASVPDSSAGNACSRQLNAVEPARGHSGLARHKRIVASCLALSIAIIGLSLFDLNSLIAQKLEVDGQMNVHPQPHLVELSPNLSYGNGANNSFYRSYYDPVLSEGLTPVVESTLLGKRVGFVDVKGNQVIKPQFGSARGFADGLAGVMMPQEQQLHPLDDTARTRMPEYHGFTDRNGKMVIPPTFSATSDFFDGSASVAFSGAESGAVIDNTGKVLIKLESMPISAKGIYIAEAKTGEFGILNSKASWLLKPQFSAIKALPQGFYNVWSYVQASSISDNWSRPDAAFYKICKGGKWGVVDRSGNILIQPIYDDLTDFSNGHARVKVENHTTFAGTDGKMWDQRYDDATPFDKLIAVKSGKKWQFVSDSGKNVSTPHIDGIIRNPLTGRWLENGRGAVIINNECGYVDEFGKIVIAPQFDFVQSFSEGFAGVRKGPFMHYIDVAGKRTSPDFGSAFPLRGGKSEITLPGPLYQFADGSKIQEIKVHLDVLKKGSLTDPGFIQETQSD